MPPAAAASRRRGDGFTILETGLAERGAHIDQAGAEHRAVRLDHGGTVGTAETGTEIGDQAVAHQQLAWLIQPGARIDIGRR